MAVEVDVAGDVVAAVKIAVVVVVGNLVEVDAAVQVPGNLLIVVPFELVAVVAVAFLVVRHPVAVKLAGIFGLEIAELSAQMHAAAADDARSNGGVVVGREVEVVGQGQLEAV